MFYGFNAPFFGGKEKVMSRQEDERLIKNDLLQLLLTAPGERIMRSDFGAPIRPFLFEQMSSAALDELRDAISDTIDKFEPRVKVSEINIEANDNNILNIKIFGKFSVDRFQNRNSPRNGDLLIEFNLSTNNLRINNG